MLLLSMVVTAAAGNKLPVTSEPPMIFALVRSSQAGCEPNCPQWIQAEGQIMGDTAIKFSNFMKKIGYKPYPLLVSSGGGRVDVAMKMGRQIRKLKMDVAVGATAYSSCSPRSTLCKLPKERKGVYSGYSFSAGSFCNSACPMIVAAGVRRVVGSWAYLGVHQVTTQWTKSQTQYKVKYRIKNGKKKIIDRKAVGREVLSNYTTTKLTANQRLQITGYYKSMGVNPSIVDKMLATPASSILQLNQVEMLNLGLVTSLEQADLFTSQVICKAARPADNCVLDKSAVAAEAKPAEAKMPVATVITPTEVKAPVLAQGASKRTKEVSDFKDEQSMWFVRVRSVGTECEPLCPEWIAAEGRIEADTAQKFERFIAGLQGKRLPLMLSSSGGAVDDAVALAEAVRKQKMDVAIARTFFVGCMPLQDGCADKALETNGFRGTVNGLHSTTHCFSTCIVVLASGKTRLVGILSDIGVFQITTHPARDHLQSNLQLMDFIVKDTAVYKNIMENNMFDRFSVKSFSAPDRLKIDRYLKRTELTASPINAIYVADMQVYMNSTMIKGFTQIDSFKFGKKLSLETMLNIKLVTSDLEADTLTKASICKLQPVPENCITALK